MHRAIAGAALAILLTGCGKTNGDAGDFAEIPGIGATRIDVPRPTRGAEADCTPVRTTGETIADRAAALRGIGLFADRAALTDAELGDEVEAAIDAILEYETAWSWSRGDSACI